MSIHTKFAAAISLSLLVATPVVSQEVTADTVISVVNGTNITVGHMIVLRNALPDQYQSLPDDVLYDGLLEQLEQQTLLAEKITDPDLMTNLRLENERRSILAGSAIQDLADNAVTDEALQAAYDARYAEQEPALEYNASHILVETEEEAQAIISELQGGSDFAELAKTKSTGPSGANGGELGWFAGGVMVQPFEEAVATMTDGQVSDPVQTQFGWHVIKLNETRSLAAPSLDDVRAELTTEVEQGFVENALKEMAAAAEITRPDLPGLDPSVIRNLELVQP